MRVKVPKKHTDFRNAGTGGYCIIWIEKETDVLQLSATEKLFK